MTNAGVILCSMCMVGHTKDAEHEMTPTRVSFCAQRAREFVKESTVNEILNEKKKLKYLFEGLGTTAQSHPHRLPMPIVCCC
jgi:hypothetical protein